MARESLYPLDQRIERAFDRSQILAVEIDLDRDSTAAQVAQLMASEGLYSRGDDLSRHISHDLMRRVDSLARVWGVPPTALRAMRPWFLAMRLSALAVEAAGISADYGIDFYFMKKARARSMAVRALETAALHMGIFRDLTEEQEEQFLRQTLDESLRAQEMVDTLLPVWSRGDTAALAALIFGESWSDESMRTLRERIYDDRNKRMADSIFHWASQNERVFVVVGSAHLVGELGIPSLLRRRGCAVSQH